MKLVILSDIHLMTAEDQDRDPGNLTRLEAPIQRINTAYDDADLVVIAGDLADRGRYIAPYEALKPALTHLKPPHALTIGNHDARENFTAVFGKKHSDPDGFIQSVHAIGDYRVLVLDSVSDAPAPEGYRGARSPLGQLCDPRLAWLEQQLDAAKGHPVIVILHHPPLKLQITTDFMALDAPEALTDLLAAHGNVRQVISGHIHMTTTALHRGIPFTTIAGGSTTSAEDFGRAENKHRREGPAQMAVVLGDTEQVTVHFDNYQDANTVV